MKITLAIAWSVFALLSALACSPSKSKSTKKDASSLGDDTVPGARPPAGQAAGLTFYNSSVLTMISNHCSACHNEPRFGGNAPLTIFNYNVMKPKLANGSGVTNNELINKVQSLISHTGGNRCPGGLTDIPCKVISDWYRVEYPGSVAGVIGAVTFVSPQGQVTGWAYDTTTPSAPINVLVYVDGPFGTGQLVGQYLANGSGFGQAANRTFTFALPAGLRNNQVHELYIYGKNTSAQNLLPGMPYEYEAYTPRQAGVDFYNNNLRSILINRCGGCHDNEYNARYQSLLTPTPYFGGTATANALVRHPNGYNGHMNFCNGLSNSPCNLIQQWWNIEFN